MVSAVLTSKKSGYALTADVLSVIILLALCATGIWLVLNTDAVVWVNLLYDDAYYYLGVARGIVEHGQSSFLPPFETNGYQPLWLLLLTLLGFLFGTTEQSLVIQAYTASFFFVLLFVFLSKKYYGLGFPAAVCALAFSYLMISGMETAMLPVFFLLFMNSKSWKSRGTWGSLLFLTRLDTLAVIVARDLYFYIRRREIALKHYLIIVPVVGIYFVFNSYYFGTPVPVSGLAKSVGSVLGENLNVGLGYIKGLMRALVLLAVVVLAFYIAKRRLTQLRHFDELVILSIACLVCMLYYGLNSGWPVWEWYYWAPFLITYYVLMELVHAFQLGVGAKSGYLRYGFIVLFAAAFYFVAKPAIAFSSGLIQKLDESRPVGTSFAKTNLELVSWIKKNIPENAFFAMGDRAGSFGFFLGDEYRFLHTEGLVGPFAYYRALAADNALGFIDNIDITYWVAERERFMETADVIGLIEPIQGVSSRRGPYLICFQKQGVVLEQSYEPQRRRGVNGREIRYVLDSKYRVSCPAEMQDQFAELRKRYGGVREYSLPYEYQARSVPSKWLNLPW